MHSQIVAAEAAAVGELYRGYVTAALFTEELEAQHDETSLDAQARMLMKSQCAQFLAGVREVLAHSGLTLEQTGHDFWLTRNGHGSGFWDRGLEDIGEALSEAAKEFGEQYLYVGDDGKLYAS